MECDNLLIDGKNCIYRAIYAGLSDKKFVEKKYHPAVIFFRFITSYVYQYRPKNVHIFWDAPKETLWRKKSYPE